MCTETLIRFLPSCLCAFWINMTTLAFFPATLPNELDFYILFSVVTVVNSSVNIFMISFAQLHLKMAYSSYKIAQVQSDRINSVKSDQVPPQHDATMTMSHSGDDIL